MFKKLKRALWLVSIASVCMLVMGWLILFLWPTPPLLKNINFSRAVYDENKHLLRLTLSQDEKYRLYTPLDDISPILVKATLLQEDQYFYWHVGVNPYALLKATWQTYVMHSRRIGASTITMQLARIRFNIQSKSVYGKCWQILRALQLETHYTKNQILEAYLNLIPYGNNVEGAGAASLIYFDKSAKALTLPEALTLSVIPQHPSVRSPQHQDLQKIRAKLYARWIKIHPKDSNQRALFNLPLQIQTIHQVPFLAPHFVDMVLHQVSLQQREINTTLSLPLQRMVEQITHQYLSSAKANGVNNAAVLLLDTRNMEIKAMLGSADFNNAGIKGQINGTLIKRSPGSTLKPFIYGLALDQGLIHPDTMLKDVPQSFGNYNPENFDNEFMGPLSARKALILSRNIPAVYLADQLNNPDLYELLENAQVQSLKPKAFYGLTMALGGAELTMQELSELYAMLANGGDWQSLRFIKTAPLRVHHALLSPEASYLVLDMLTHAPPNTMHAALQSDALPIAWKTGTSSGYRDAWTVGVFGPYVLAVWLGNFDDEGNHALIGKEIAAPLFFSLIDAMKAQYGPIPKINYHLEKLHLTKVAVCKASGMLPTRYCHDTELTWFIPGKSPIKTDTIFREIPIDKCTGERTCHFNQNTIFKVYEFWPTDILSIYKLAGIERLTPPPFEAGCEYSLAGLSPHITSPKTQLSYIINPYSHKKAVIPMTATVDADVNTLYWFIDETFLAKTQASTPYLWIAKPGNYVVRVVDDHGRSDARDIEIKVDGGR